MVLSKNGPIDSPPPRDSSNVAHGPLIFHSQRCLFKAITTYTTEIWNWNLKHKSPAWISSGLYGDGCYSVAAVGTLRKWLMSRIHWICMNAALLKRLEIDNRIVYQRRKNPFLLLSALPLQRRLCCFVRSGVAEGFSVTSKCIYVTISAAGVPFG